MCPLIYRNRHLFGTDSHFPLIDAEEPLPPTEYHCAQYQVEQWRLKLFWHMRLALLETRKESDAQS